VLVGRAVLVEQALQHLLGDVQDPLALLDSDAATSPARRSRVAARLSTTPETSRWAPNCR
jgi:hypothetical protein